MQQQLELVPLDILKKFMENGPEYLQDAIAKTEKLITLPIAM